MAPLLARLGLGRSGFGFGKRTVSSGAAAFATGGTVTAAGIVPGNGYRYHVFTAPGTFTVFGSGNVEYLVVAGGGGGGSNQGGGGGAGGFRTNVPGHPLAGSPFPVSVTSYPVTVGPGGAGGPNTARFSPPGTGDGASDGDAGSPSSFGPITSTGGGSGSGYQESPGVSPAADGNAGGSGGGGGRGGNPYNLSTSGGAGNSPATSPSQGNSGGGGGAFTPGPIGDPNHTYLGGGGGGAGGTGATASGTGTPAVGGAGGAGSPIPAFAAPLIQPEISAPVWPTFGPTVGPTGLYAGGGGGGASKQPGTGGSPSSGGSGGGGTGGGSTAGGNAVTFTGSGGGGAGGGGNAGNGGDGIVIIRYLA